MTRAANTCFKHPEWSGKQQGRGRHRDYPHWRKRSVGRRSRLPEHPETQKAEQQRSGCALCRGLGIEPVSAGAAVHADEHCEGRCGHAGVHAGVCCRHEQVTLVTVLLPPVDMRSIRRRPWGKSLPKLGSLLLLTSPLRLPPTGAAPHSYAHPQPRRDCGSPLTRRAEHSAQPRAVLQGKVLTFCLAGMQV